MREGSSPDVHPQEVVVAGANADGGVDVANIVAAQIRGTANAGGALGALLKVPAPDPAPRAAVGGDDSGII